MSHIRNVASLDPETTLIMNYELIRYLKYYGLKGQFINFEPIFFKINMNGDTDSMVFRGGFLILFRPHEF